VKIVAVTACPTGIAHTYMAAELLAKAAAALGHEIRVETQGAMGVENRLSARDVRDCDVVLLAADIEVEERDRFEGKRIVEVPVKEAIQRPEAVLRRLAP
jgi:fructose-specific phosphotransferase system IIB component